MTSFLRLCPLIGCFTFAFFSKTNFQRPADRRSANIKHPCVHIQAQLIEFGCLSVLYFECTSSVRLLLEGQQLNSIGRITKIPAAHSFTRQKNRENFVLQVTPNAESSITFSVLHTKGLIGTILILLRCANVTLYLSRAAGFGHRVCGWIRIRGDCNTADGEILKDEVLSNRNAA